MTRKKKHNNDFLKFILIGLTLIAILTLFSTAFLLAFIMGFWLWNGLGIDGFVQLLENIFTLDEAINYFVISSSIFAITFLIVVVSPLKNYGTVKK